MGEVFSEFERDGLLPRAIDLHSGRKLSSIHRSEIAVWTVWAPDHEYYQRIVRSADQQKGEIGTWRWERMKSVYPVVWTLKTHSFQNLRSLDEASNWTGLLRIMGPPPTANISFASRIETAYSTAPEESAIRTKGPESHDRKRPKEGAIVWKHAQNRCTAC